jgi:diguanylate cyclase (GGDEF)-like protein
MEKRIYSIINILMIVGAVWVMLVSAKNYGHMSPVKTAESRLITVDDGWTDENGQAVDVTALQELDGVEPGKSFSIYLCLPEDLSEGQTLFFRTKNINVKVYLGEECLYESNIPEPALNSKSVGTNWNFVELPASGAGKTLRFEITTTYKTAKSRIDDAYIGYGRDCLLVTLNSKLVSISTCVMFIFVGVLLMLIDIPLSIGKNKTHEFLYLGLFSLSVSMWCMLETYSIQIFTGDARTVHVTSCCMLMMVSVAAMRYLYAAYGEEMKYIARVVIGLSTFEYILNIILQLTGVADFQYTLKLSHIMLGISALVLFVEVMKNTIKDNKKSKSLFFKVIRGLGLGTIAFSTFIDIVRYYMGNTQDPARYVRIGVLLFIVCYAISSIEKFVDTMKMGTKAELISQLAYRDGLTDFGNRTLFNERIAELNEHKLDDSGQEIGIIMFDINNLKQVNDRLGHQAGDEMLKAGAELIAKVYGECGECFRIGGDEFVCIIKGKAVEEMCQKLDVKFAQLMVDYNKSTDKSFHVRVASGYSIYNTSMGDRDVREIYKIADSNMYEKKKKMKSLDKTDVIIRFPA